MRNLLTLQPNIADNSIQNNLLSKKLKISDIEKFYLSSMKSQSLFGLEYERLSLDKTTGKSAKYEDVSCVIENFCKITDWEIIKDENTVIGARSIDGCSISLEPGCQLEISLRPYENISDIDLRLSKIVSITDEIAKAYNIIFLPFGINPSQTPDEIELLNKRRYKIMNNYLPNCKKAELCTSMMRKTAGIQVNIDYSDKKDAYLKLKFFNLILPFVCGLSANSHIVNGAVSEFKSARANIWQYTGANRCNLFYKDIFEHKIAKFNNIFKNYIDNILDVPMVFIERNNECIPINGLVTFREYMKSGFMDFKATPEDYILHQSLCFPDVRLKKYIEIRNHDTNRPEYALMLCALYKGLIKEKTENLLKTFGFLKIDYIEDYYKCASRFGLDFKLNEKLTAWNIASILLETARKNLSTKERCYLEPMINMVKNKKTSADCLLDMDIKTTKELVSYFS